MQDIVWYTETMSVDTFHEAFEWVTSGPYNEIGHLYTGYKTTNWMLAHVLLYELIRRNTIFPPSFLVHTDYDFISNGLLFKIWVSPLAADAYNETKPGASHP